MSQKKKCQTEVFSRVTGFYRPVQSWNKGKAQEFQDRQKFKMDIAGAQEGTKENDNSRAAKSFIS